MSPEMRPKSFGTLETLAPMHEFHVYIKQRIVGYYKFSVPHPPPKKNIIDFNGDHEAAGIFLWNSNEKSETGNCAMMIWLIHCPLWFAILVKAFPFTSFPENDGKLLFGDFRRDFPHWRVICGKWKFHSTVVMHDINSIHIDEDRKLKSDKRFNFMVALGSLD